MVEVPILKTDLVTGFSVTASMLSLTRTGASEAILRFLCHLISIPYMAIEKQREQI